MTQKEQRDCVDCRHCLVSLKLKPTTGRTELVTSQAVFQDINIQRITCGKQKWAGLPGSVPFTSLAAFKASRVGAKYAPDCRHYDSMVEEE